MTLSRRVRYVTVQFVPRRTAAELANCLKQVITVYRRAGFICRTALMDGEFEKVKKKVIDCIEVNITARNEHVLEIERKIRVIKERARCYKADMPVKELPSIIIKRMVLNAVLFLNAYVDKQGISEEYSPRELILRWQLHWKRHCKYHFGAYGEAYDDPDPTITNTQQLRSRSVICLGPTGNMQGSFFFLDLNSKAVIKCRKFVKFPMPDSMIRKLEAWGRINRMDDCGSATGTMIHLNGRTNTRRHSLWTMPQNQKKQRTPTCQLRCPEWYLKPMSQRSRRHPLLRERTSWRQGQGWRPRMLTLDHEY